jgi:hypothetical protein
MLKSLGSAGLFCRERCNAFIWEVRFFAVLLFVGLVVFGGLVACLFDNLLKYFRLDYLRFCKVKAFLSA